MCDYSLHNVAARPAKVGDKLVSTCFPNSITRGFAAIGEPNVSVCLPPGTELAFETEVKYEAAIAFLPKKKVGESVARFRYVDNGFLMRIETRSNFPAGRSCCSRGCVKVSMRPCFSCRRYRTLSTRTRMTNRPWSPFANLGSVGPLR